MCGVNVVDFEADYTGVHVKWSNGLGFPRKLTPELECSNPFDCISQCEKLRDLGVAPATCTYCNTPCHVNALVGSIPFNP